MLFSLSEATSETLIQKLEQNNKDIGDLLGHSLRMESIRVPKSASNAKHYELIQECARSLYSILKKTFTLPCGCSAPHKASLRLQLREQSNKTGSPLDVDFNVLFSFEAHTSMHGSLPWNWRETSIKSLERSDHEENPSLTSLPRKRVMFAPITVGDVAQNVRTPSVQPDKIDCLCEAMNIHVQSETCLGVLVDEMHRQHRITIRNKAPCGKVPETVSLTSLLSDLTPLEKRDRLAMGVKFASVSSLSLASASMEITMCF